jgi:hypothetical protein
MKGKITMQAATCLPGTATAASRPVSHAATPSIVSVATHPICFIKNNACSSADAPLIHIDSTKPVCPIAPHYGRTTPQPPVLPTVPSFSKTNRKYLQILFAVCPSNYYLGIECTCPCGGSACDNLLSVQIDIKSIFNVLSLKLTFSEALNLNNLNENMLIVAIRPQTHVYSMTNPSISPSPKSTSTQYSCS